MSSDTMTSSERWYAERKAAQAAERAAMNMPGKEATPRERAIATGHTTNWPISNPWSELSHMGGWSFPAIDAIASQWENASVCMYSKRPKQVNKSASAHDAPDPQRTPIHDHPLLDLLERPNPIFWREIFFYQLATHYCLTGGFVIWEVKNQETGLPVELWALPRAWLTFQTGSVQFPLGLWRVQNPRGISSYGGVMGLLAGGFYIDVRDTIILNRPHPLYPGEPLGTISACKNIVDIAEMTDTSVWTSLVQSPRPGMIILLDKDTMIDSAEQDRLVAKIQDYKGGANNVGAVMMMKGMKADKLGTSLNDLQAEPLRKQNQEMMSAIHSVPPIATGYRTDVGSYAGDAASVNTWIELHIQTMLNRVAGCFNHRFHRYWPGEVLEMAAKRFDDPILDMQRADSIKDAVTKGGAAWNEWRSSMKLAPKPGLDEIKEPTPPQVPGKPGQGGGLPASEGDDLPDDTTTGMKQPDRLGGQTGSRLPAFLSNGKVSANGKH